MAANDPVSKCVACQFNIEPADFNFAPAIPGDPSSPSGALPPPTAPGFASIIKALIDAFIAAVTFLIAIVDLLINNIIDFIDWVNTLLSDPIQFMLDLFDLIILQPFTNALQVDIPPFDIELKIFGSTVSVPVPAVSGASPPPVPGTPSPTSSNPNWATQIPGYMKLLIGLLTFPFDVLMALVDELTKFNMPAVNQEFLERIWDAILPSMGFAPGTEAFESVSKVGMCVVEQLLPLVPPSFPPNGFSPGAAPISVIDSLPATTLIHDESSVSMNNVTAPPRQFQVTKANSGTHTVETMITGATSHFVLTAPPLSLTNAQPSGVFFIQLLTNDPTTSHEISVTIKVTDPANEVTVFKFKVTSNEKSLLQMLQEGYEKFGGTWDPEFNIWAVRRRVGQTYSDQFEDAIGLSYFLSGTWQHYVVKGTTKPGVYWANSLTPGPQVLKPMFQKDIWRKRNHYQQFPALVAANYTTGPVEDRAIGVTVAFVDGGKKCKQRPQDRVITATNQVIDLHTTAQGANQSGPTPTIVGRWSAGCTVIQNISEFYTMMFAIFNNYAERRAYSYMLFTDTQVPQLDAKVTNDYGV